ncbi:hypothetical protein ACES2J_04665 [Bdellovibrio bacteriovorus]|uniref:hypothetical protein n=1 Tax=Bdellovibrio bacteriovorus TaxID=959 RepID=UPI0035A7065F
MRDMKKIVLGSLFSLFASTQALALSEIELTGELDATASVWNLPTGERGNSAFAVPSLFLGLHIPLQEDNLLVVTMEGSEQKDISPNRFDVGVREAYLDLVSVFEGMQALRAGLIPQTWQEAQYENYQYRFLGQTAWSMTEKWKYLSYSDLGVSFMSQLPHDYGEWALNLTNGEGAEEKEEGPHKEFTLFARFFKWSPWSLNLSYVRGSYDLYGADVGLKERIQGLLAYEREDEWMVALEYLATKDPADALRDYEMADGVDVTALSGQSVRGEGASLYAVVHTGPKAEILVRYDYLNPVVGEDGKDLQTAILALGYQVTDDIKAALAVDHTKYGEEFAPGARERSKLELAAQVLF